jgi:hypothetical protein
VSFDVGIRQLGGESITLTGQEMQLGRGETIADTARVLSRYVDAIMIRTLEHEMVLELAAHATVRYAQGGRGSSRLVEQRGPAPDQALRQLPLAFRGPLPQPPASLVRHERLRTRQQDPPSQRPASFSVDQVVEKLMPKAG